MTNAKPELHMLCGKIAAGKSTLAGKLANEHRAILIAEDDWLAALYRDEMKTPKDYVGCASKLQDTMAPHVQEILKLGQSVVLDFPANTIESRKWMRRLIDGTSAQHFMHVLTPPDDVCLDRLRKRNVSGAHAFDVSDAQFFEISKHFIEPSLSEGFNVVRHV